MPGSSGAGSGPPLPTGDAASDASSTSEADAGALPPASDSSASGVPSSPRVLGTVPANGATGVTRDTTLSIAFDVPMDRASVEAAFGFDGLAGGSTEFRWDTAGMLLNIVLDEPLAYATGNDPAQVAALRYAYHLSSAARDVGGNPLPETRVGFTTLRELSVSVSAEPDSALTGNWRSDGVYGTDSCGPAGASMCIGDSSFGPNASYRGFASFALSALPPGVVALQRAVFGLQVSSLLGAPSAGLGQLVLEHVPYTAIGPDAFAAASQARLASVGVLQAGSTLSLDVLPAVRGDWLGQQPSRYRLRFESASDADGATDLMFASRASATLSLTYLLP